MAVFWVLASGRTPCGLSWSCFLLRFQPEQKEAGRQSQTERHTYRMMMASGVSGTGRCVLSLIVLGFGGFGVDSFFVGPVSSRVLPQGIGRSGSSSFEGRSPSRCQRRQRQGPGRRSSVSATRMTAAVEVSFEPLEQRREHRERPTAVQVFCHTQHGWPSSRSLRYIFHYDV